MSRIKAGRVPRWENGGLAVFAGPMGNPRAAFRNAEQSERRNSTTRDAIQLRLRSVGAAVSYGGHFYSAGTSGNERERAGTSGNEKGQSRKTVQSPGWAAFHFAVAPDSGSQFFDLPDFPGQSIPVLEAVLRCSKGIS